MDAFKNYIIDEYRNKAKGFVATEFKFSHSVNLKIDKKSNVPLKNNIIKVKVTFIDKDMNTLLTTNITFENNILNKTCAKKLVNIAPKELENRFNAAKKQIVSLIMNEYCDHLNEIETKINDLKTYYGGEGIIPTEFKGEQVTVAGENEEKSKNKFDM